MERRITSLVRLIDTLSRNGKSQELTAYITLCLCHIKPRCNLFSWLVGEKRSPSDELSMYLDELAELARYGGG